MICTIYDNDYYCVAIVRDIKTQKYFMKKTFKYLDQKIEMHNDVYTADINFFINVQNKGLPFAILESFSFPNNERDSNYVITEFMKYRDLKTAIGCINSPYPELASSWDLANVKSLPDFVELNSPTLDDTQKMKTIYGMAFALNVMHKNQIVHGNIRPSSILYTETCEPLITDFVFTKDLLINNGFQSNSDKEQLIYMAPETITQKSFDFKSDVYSFSVVTLQLLNNHRLRFGNRIDPFTVRIERLREFIESKDTYNIPKAVPQLFSDLLKKGLSHSPADRVTMEDFVNYLNDTNSPPLLNHYDNNKFREYIQTLEKNFSGFHIPESK